MDIILRYRSLCELLHSSVLRTFYLISQRVMRLFMEPAALSVPVAATFSCHMQKTDVVK